MNVAVYLGSTEGNDPVYRKTAYQLGVWLAKHGHTLVYGGSDRGTMGAVCRGAASQGGRTIGVMPEFMAAAGYNDLAVSEFILTKDMAARRQKMIELADAYIAMPGGTGTLDEISEVICYRKLGLNSGPVVFYNVNGYWNDLKRQFAVMAREGFAPREELPGLHFIDGLDELAAILGQ